MAAESEFTPLVRKLGCLRGVSTLTGFALAVEIGDWHRFTGNTIGAFVGLVPGEHSSGSSRVQGSITKADNTHVRRLLVEAAWHHRARYTWARLCATAGTWPPLHPWPVAMRVTADSTTAG
jgi:transposase